MKVYIWASDTKVYLGEKECQPSPLEPGEFLYPSKYTKVKPPDPVEGKEIFFDEAAGEWFFQDIPEPPLPPDPPDPAVVKKEKLLADLLYRLPVILYDLKVEKDAASWLSAFMKEVEDFITTEEAKDG